MSKHVPQSARAKAAGVKPSAKVPRKPNKVDRIAAVLARIEAGELVGAACQAEGLKRADLYAWRDASPENGTRYARARELQADAIAEDSFAIVDDTSRDTLLDKDGSPYPDKEWIARSKLRAEQRRWYLEKVAPRHYGQKVDVTSGGEPLTPDRLSRMSTDEIKAEIARRLGGL